MGARALRKDRAAAPRKREEQRDGEERKKQSRTRPLARDSQQAQLKMRAAKLRRPTRRLGVVSHSGGTALP